MVDHLQAWVQALSRRSWLCLVAVAYFSVLAVEFILTGTVMRWLDQNYPSVYFYHLHEGENSGPLGDLDAAWLAIRIGYGLLCLLFIPLAIFLQVPILGTISLLLLKEPAEMLMFVGLAYLIHLLGI